MSNLSNSGWALLNLLAGCLLTLSFAPLSYSYLAFFSLTLLFYSWLKCSPLQAAIRGYCFGLGMFSLGVTWVFVSIYFYGNASVFASVLLSELFAAFWALFPALAGYLSVRLAHFTQQRFLLGIFPLVWILIEYVRGYCVLNGFPWLQIAYSQIDTPYAGFIPIVGVYGTGFLVAITAAFLADMLYFKRQYLLLSASLIVLIGSGCLLKQVQWTTKAGAPFQATLVQGNISQDEKWQEDRLLKTLLTYQQMTNNHWDSQVIVWPETSIPTYLSRVDKPFLTPLEQQAISHHTDLVVSLLEKNDETGAVYNSALVLGKKRAVYRKNHLLPFGEYMPLQPLSGWVLDNIGIRLDDFAAGGNRQPLLEAAGYSFITSICYEDAFGSEAIAQLSDAAYLVNLSNDAWFGRSFEPYQHLQMARMRAIETGRYMLRATNTGATAIIAPDGKIIKQAPLFETVTITDTIFPMSGITPYVRLGDTDLITSLSLLLLILLTFGRKKQIILLFKRGSRLS